MTAAIRRPSDPEYQPSGFFVLRTPLLPFEEIEAWSAGLAAPQAAAGGDPAALAAAVAADRELLRARLRALLERPEIFEALFVASPSLVDGLEIWRQQPDSKKGLRAERALVRYFYRMGSRPTPFGLFSGCSTALLGGDGDGARPTQLRLAARPRYQRHTRLDMDYLFALCEELERDPGLRRELRYRPNSSLYRAAGRLRYAEARLDDKKVRSHHLVAVETTSYLEETLGRARGGAVAGELEEALVAADPDGEITAEDAAGFIAELIDSQVLVSDLSPPVTGPEPIHDLIASLSALPAGRAAAARLAETRDALAELDAAGAGPPPERYRTIAARLEELPAKVELARLFQVDMVKPGDEPALGAAVLEELARGVDLMRRLGRPRNEGLERFRKEFEERYGEGREVPLVEALDEEIGIGFERSSEVGAEASPLLRGLALAPPAGEPTVPWGERQALLLAKLAEALARGDQRIELSAEDLERLAGGGGNSGGGDRGGGERGGGERAGGSKPQPFPDAYQVMGVVAAASEEALERGEFQLLFSGCAGPSGARLLGRFCHADELLREKVEEHLRAEEELQPEAVFAEIAHLPQGRIGNVLSRPLMRRYEIPFLGRSGAPEERQIPITDLTVSVRGSRIALRSMRLGREVVPRLTSAHNFALRSLGVYRFLCMLQTQEVLGGGMWSWGPLESAPFLPRLTSGRLVLCRASWLLSADEIKPLAKSAGPERYAAVQELRRRRRLPRLLILADGDNELLVDLDNALSIDAFLDLIESRDRAQLHEFFPGPDELPARGPEGRFVHELVVPFHRLPRPAASAAAAEGSGDAGVASESAFGIQSESAFGITSESASGGQSERAFGGQSESASGIQSESAFGAGRQRSFPPGSEWLYAKLYTGTSTADRVLRELVSPLLAETLGSAADGWFFIRYGDPEWHLRLRFHGDPAALSGRVLPALHAAAAPLLADGRLWRLQLDTYEREVERYGGPAGIAIAERLFQLDSQAVLEVLDLLEGDEGADARWRLAFYGVDAMLNDLGLDVPAKLAVLERLRLAFGKELAGGADGAAWKQLQVQIDQRFRTERPRLEPLLDAAGDPENPLAPALAVLLRRSQASAPLAAELRRLEAGRRLAASMDDLAFSFVHMHVNRLIRSAQRAHELVLYDFLYQTHRSRAARARGKLPQPRQAAETGR
ncbi:MAG TPA: lantibiotic dehydratase [Thermoanaerobaculia bacterium]|nr:lantibiotic dehydratase [Thermoanaerobaculia bacterium]